MWVRAWYRLPLIDRHAHVWMWYHACWELSVNDQGFAILLGSANHAARCRHCFPTLVTVIQKPRRLPTENGDRSVRIISSPGAIAPS